MANWFSSWIKPKNDSIWVIRTRTGKKLDKCHFFFKSQRLLRTEKSKNSYTFKSYYLILASGVLKIWVLGFRHNLGGARYAQSWVFFHNFQNTAFFGIKTFWDLKSFWTQDALENGVWLWRWPNLFYPKFSWTHNLFGTKFHGPLIFECSTSNRIVFICIDCHLSGF